MFDPDKHPDYYIDDSESTSEEQTATPVNRQSGQIDFSDANVTGPTETVQPKRRRRGGKCLVMFILILVAVCAGLIYIRYFNPYATDVQITGYVKNIQRSGIIFKTYEGELIPDQSIYDTSGKAPLPFMFSIPDAATAKMLQDIQNTRQKVKITYSKYYGVLSWRGATTNELNSAQIEE